MCVWTGTGLQIPPAAQQALQMSGAIAIGALAAVSGKRITSQLICSCSSISSQLLTCLCSSCHESTSDHEHEHSGAEPAVSATRHSLLPAVQHVQPQQVRAHLVIRLEITANERKAFHIPQTSKNTTLHCGISIK